MAEKLSRERIEQILVDLRNEPPWRAEAQREADMYDGNQLDSDTLSRMEEIGIPPIIVNLIKPTVDTVLGLETKTRTDPIVRSENNESREGAEGLNEKLKEAIRMTRFNRGTSDAFAGQCKAGMGWVEVSRESDPFKYPYRVCSVHRSEIWPDWRSRQPDYSDGRYLVRRRWYDSDELETFFPKYKMLIRQSMSMRPLWEGSDDIESSLGRAWDIERTTSLQNEEWRDTERHRLALYEVWYKVFSEVWVLDLPDGRVVELNKKDPRHIQAVATGMIEPRKAPTQRIRVAYYLGPHQMTDEPSPYRHGRFPYSPMFGYREDKSGIPYGLIRAMKSPQEEVNARRSKMLYNLSTRRVITDRDAVKDHKQTAAEVARPDSYIILDENRKNANGFRIDSDAGLNAQQFQLMGEAKNNVQEASGMFQEMMGRSAGGGQSGEAIKSLVEQGTQVLGEIFDNYQEGRRIAADMLLSLVIEDLSKQNNVPVEVEDGSGETKQIILNKPELDEFGQPFRTNDVMRLRMRVVLDETPSTPSYRQQVLGRIMDLTQSLPPNIQASVIDLVVDATDLPNRKAFVERIRAATGAGSSDSPEAQQAAKKEQELQQREIELVFKEREAKITEIEQKAREAQAKVEKILAEARKIAGVDTHLDQARTEKTYNDIQSDRRENDRRDIEQGASFYERSNRLPPDPRQGLPNQQHPNPNPA